MDLTRGRYEYPSLKAAAIALAQKYRPQHVLIEDASTGIALAQELKSIRFDGSMRLVPVERDKIGRLYINQAKFERGDVSFPMGAHFLPALETELLTFPQGKTDDQVDSISQALLMSLVSIQAIIGSSNRGPDGYSRFGEGARAFWPTGGMRRRFNDEGKIRKNFRPTEFFAE